MEKRRMVNMILVAANKTGGTIARVRISVGNSMLLDLPVLEPGERSPPALYDGPSGSHVWRVWLVDPDGNRRRGSVQCSVTPADNDKCTLIVLHRDNFVINKRHHPAIF